MRFLLPFLLTVACFCCFGDDRTFTFTHVQAGDDFGQAALIMAKMVFPAEVTSNETTRSVTVRGTSNDAALGAWIFEQLDAASSDGAAQIDKTETGDVVAVLNQSSAANVRGLQESATVIRSVAEIRSLFTYSRLRLIFLRGTEAQANLAQWLAGQFDLAIQGKGAPVTKTFDALHSNEDTIAVLYLNSAPSVETFQQAVVQLRTASHVRRVFTYNAPRAVVARDTAERVAAIESMIQARN